MKRKYIYPVIVIILLGLIIASSTYAYLNWATDNTQKSNVAFTIIASAADYTCSADGGGNITPGDIELRTINCTNSPEYVIQREITINNTIDTEDKTIYMDLWLKI